jgi:hypothetical protein
MLNPFSRYGFTQYKKPEGGETSGNRTNPARKNSRICPAKNPPDHIWLWEKMQRVNFLRPGSQPHKKAEKMSWRDYICARVTPFLTKGKVDVASLAFACRAVCKTEQRPTGYYTLANRK